MNEGWKCPECGACYAPWVPKCESCTGIKVVINQTIDNQSHCQHIWGEPRTNGTFCTLCGTQQIPPPPTTTTCRGTNDND